MFVLCWQEAHVLNILKIIRWQLVNNFIDQVSINASGYTIHLFKWGGFRIFWVKPWRSAQVSGTSVSGRSFTCSPSDVRLEMQACAFPTWVPFTEQFYSLRQFQNSWCINIPGAICALIYSDRTLAMHMQTYGRVSLRTKMPVNFELSLQGTLIYTEMLYIQKSNGLREKVDLRPEYATQF